MHASLSVETANSQPVASATPQRRWSRRVAVDVVGLLDALAIALGTVLPALIYSICGGLTMRWPVVLQTGLLTALVATWCLNLWRTYDADSVHDYQIGEGRLLAALAIAFAAVLGVGLPFGTDEPHLWVWYAVWASLSFLLLLTNRVVARQVLSKAAASGAFDIRIAVYGAGPIARRVRDHLVDPSSRIAFAGMFDDRPGERVNSEGLTFAGRLEDLIALAHDGRVDRIIIALPASADERISMIAKRLAAAPASVHIVTHVASDLVDVKASHEVSSLGGVGLLDVKGRTFGDWKPMVKRAEDIVLASLGLIVAVPLMAIAALLVWLESVGPVLVTERRRGLNQKTLALVRFRTMRYDDMSPSTGAPTRVGAVLERFGLDRLPQLFNVLTGDMSIVGPAAQPAKCVTASAIADDKIARHQMKPGLTGLAMLPLERGQPFASETSRDLAYIARWNPALDLWLIWQSIRSSLGGREQVSP